MKPHFDMTGHMFIWSGLVAVLVGLAGATAAGGADVSESALPNACTTPYAVTAETRALPDEALAALVGKLTSDRMFEGPLMSDTVMAQLSPRLTRGNPDRKAEALALARPHIEAAHIELGRSIGREAATEAAKQRTRAEQEELATLYAQPWLDTLLQLEMKRRGGTKLTAAEQDVIDRCRAWHDGGGAIRRQSSAMMRLLSLKSGEALAVMIPRLRAMAADFAEAGLTFPAEMLRENRDLGAGSEPGE